ncbi:MAG: hypothetical protein SP1CHLAM9_02340 [Chlamydiia bacterium]|nr:hypothetical protein [Chlamydiia bacterium]MCH9624460.1 hypothetical protein [Chlamydiia bacterium]
MVDCIFCNLDKSLIIEEGDAFRVILDPYPLCESHIMIVSKEHVGCTGELTKKQLIEMEYITKKIESSFMLDHGGFISYEHGRAGVCIASQEIPCFHMHMHYLPLSLDINVELKDQYSHLPVTCLSDIQRYFHSKGEYLFFKNSLKAGFFPVLNKSIPPHLLRTLIARKMNMPHLASIENYAGFF